MKKILLAVVGILALVFLSGCSEPFRAMDSMPGFSLDAGLSEPAVPKDTWTIIIHFAIDNNLDFINERNAGIISNYLAALESIEAGDTGNKINIAVLMDGYWGGSTFTDGYYHLTGGAFADDLMIPRAEINSGILADTTAFLDWALANYPADGYMYSIYDHGTGFNDTTAEGTSSARGIGLDNSSDDCLTHRELGLAFDHIKAVIGRNLDLFYADACLMGGVELAFELRDNTDYILFSEEEFPVNYWSFEALSTITDSPVGVTAEQIGTAFCDSAYEFFSLLETGLKNFTLSLVRLDEIPLLAQLIDEYANSAITDMQVNRNNAFYNTVAHESWSMLSLGGFSDFYYMDLGDYCSRIQAHPGISPLTKEKAAAVMVQLSAAVVYMRNPGYPDAHGMTIFHNIWKSGFEYPVETYKLILKFGTNSWADYMDRMHGIIDPPVGDDAYEDDDTRAQAKPIIINAPAQSHTLSPAGDRDYLAMELVEGRIYKIETYFNTIDTNTVLSLESFEPMPVAYNNNATGNYSRIIYACPATGIYSLEVREFIWADTGDYLVDVRDVTGFLDAYEPDNNTADAKPLTVDAPAQEHSLYIGDADFMDVSLTAGRKYHFETFFKSIPTDTVLTLIDSSTMNTVAYDDNSGTDNYSAVDFGCTASGTYYVAVIENGQDDEGDYVLTVEDRGTIIGAEIEITGKISVKGWDPFTYLALTTGDNMDYTLTGYLVPDLWNNYQNQTVTLRVIYRKDAIGPGFPAEVEVLEMIE
ncbi:MAG: pre-peptidase C-terminal domain-containing protein [Spirochaetales bacterium]|nr:pre-peptidase C-terminal domain-containing protein [Spirochaetales bacterium]